VLAVVAVAGGAKGSGGFFGFLGGEEAAVFDQAEFPGLRAVGDSYQ
jgi:hypothetical protein